MATLEQQVHKARRSLSVADAEALVESAAEEDVAREWHLDLSETQHVQPLAGLRLAALLRGLARHRLTVTLPSARSRFLVLHRSGLLPAIAAHADEIHGPTEKTLEQLRQEPHRSIEAQTTVLFNRIDDGGLVLDKDRFGSRLWSARSRWMSNVEPGLDRIARAALAGVGYESIANVVDHAYARPFDGGERRAAFCLLTWQREMTVEGEDELGLAEYLRPAKEQFGGQELGWFILSVADDGNGIPARWEFDADIYRGSVSSEERALATALEDGASIKLDASDAEIRGEPGWGLWLMAQALRDVRGYGCIRTGRHAVELDAFSAMQRWTIRPKVLGPLSGTVLQFVIPVPSPQLSLV